MNKKLEKRDNVIIALYVALAVAVLCCGVLGVVLGIGGVSDTTMGVAQAYSNGGQSSGRTYTVRQYDLSGYFDDGETTIFYTGDSTLPTQMFTLLSWDDLSYAIRDLYYSGETWDLEYFQLSHIPVQIFADLTLNYAGGTFYSNQIELEFAMASNFFDYENNAYYEYRGFNPSTIDTGIVVDNYRCFANCLELIMFSDTDINMRFNVQFRNVKVVCFDYRGEYDIIYDYVYNRGEEGGYGAGYDAGYEVGEDAGYDAGVAYGYTQGFSYGKIEGRNQGYTEGVADAGDYTFFSLVTSIFDAPLKVLVGEWVDTNDDGIVDEMRGGMLNFYIPVLDVNLAPLLLSLFTLCIIIIVVRFVLARL